MHNLKLGLQYIDREEIYLKGIRDIVLMGDVGCTSLTKESKKILNKILKLKTDLFIILGDLVRSGTAEEFKEVIGFCNERARVPIFTLCGNHDLPSYSEFLGSSSYAIILDKYVIIALDNADRLVKEEDVAFLDKELRKHSRKKFLILFHVPPPTDLDSRSCMDSINWQKYRTVLDQYKEKIKCISCGHIHGFEEYYLDGYHIFITGGGGAKLQNLEKDTLKSHHALRFNFKDDGTLNFKIIPINRSITL